MSMRDEYRKTALKYFMAAEEADDPDTVHRLLETAEDCVRSAAIETANHHVLAWHNKIQQEQAAQEQTPQEQTPQEQTPQEQTPQEQDPHPETRTTTV